MANAEYANGVEAVRSASWLEPAGRGYGAPLLTRPPTIWRPFNRQAN